MRFPMIHGHDLGFTNPLQLEGVAFPPEVRNHPPFINQFTLEFAWVRPWVNKSHQEKKKSPQQDLCCPRTRKQKVITFGTLAQPKGPGFFHTRGPSPTKRRKRNRVFIHHPSSCLSSLSISHTFITRTLHLGNRCWVRMWERYRKGKVFFHSSTSTCSLHLRVNPEYKETKRCKEGWTEVGNGL